MVSSEDFACLIASSGAIIIYHLQLYRSVLLYNDKKVQLNRNLQNIYTWLSKHREKKDAPNVTLAIQTLRNTILVAIFVGGASFQYAFLILSSYEYTTEEREARVLIVSSLMFFSFLNWAMVIRYASHFGYMVGQDEPATPTDNAPQLQVVDMEKGSNLVAGNGQVNTPPATAKSSSDLGENMLQWMFLHFRYALCTRHYSTYIPISLDKYR